jgi:hypothetical protein
MRVPVTQDGYPLGIPLMSNMEVSLIEEEPDATVESNK